MSAVGGELIPKADPPDLLRRIELAAIWIAEAQRELDDAVAEAARAGILSDEIGRVLGITGGAVRFRIHRLRKRGLLV